MSRALQGPDRSRVASTAVRGLKAMARVERLNSNPVPAEGMVSHKE